MAKAVFTFGSNEGGMHGAGAALFAYQKRGARYGMSYGHSGDSFAIPTCNEMIGKLELPIINAYIAGFLAYATGKRKLKFYVTRLGCGIAGFTDADIAPMFIGAPKNCMFPQEWAEYLGDGYEYFVEGQ